MHSADLSFLLRAAPSCSKPLSEAVANQLQKLRSNAVQSDLQKLLDTLADMPLQDLRCVWAAEVGPPPPLRSPDLLRRILAWRIQASAFGDLSPTTKQALKRTSDAPRQTLRLSQGVKLSREWQGRRYDVERTEQGFCYAGQTYRSLSEVARTITGVRWNGPRFFGLRDKEAA